MKSYAVLLNTLQEILQVLHHFQKRNVWENGYEKKTNNVLAQKKVI
jgi:hypothetical protein